MHHQQNLYQAAHALTSALANPYAQHSSHYLQALARATHPSTTPDGYTLSSTYTPSEYTRPQMPERKPSNPRPVAHQPRQFGSWYQPGNCRCSYQGCTFTGSQKSVEVHMMDRHLIYPPGWEKRKKKPEWDADPSLKGKPIPIQGTSIILDTPEAVKAWIAERKKRWPTAVRVAEKKRKLEEAIERGQIIPQNNSLSRKRPRPSFEQGVKEKRVGLGRGFDKEQRGKQARVSTFKTVSKSSVRHLPSNDESASSEDSDEAPEVMTSKASAIVVRPQESFISKDVEDQRKRRLSRKGNLKGPMPKKPPHNPFASRPTLLRNLLLPEIRMTLSNLSQAVRFLVDNDFLDGVELTPGEANEDKLIQVLEQSDSHS